MHFKDVLILVSIFAIAAVAYAIKDNILVKNYITEKSKPEKSVKQAQIPILLYHYVDNIDNKDDGKYNLNTKPEILEAQIQTLLENNYKIIKMSDVRDLVRQETTNKYVVLTFDDGYDDFYYNVFPLLKKYNVPAVNYVMPNFIGRELHLTKVQINEMVLSNLVEIGSHTLSHASLTSIDLQDANTEIIESKKLLEDIFGINVTSFAYPYGRYNEDIENIVKNAGYTNAVTTDGGNIVSDNGFYVIPRIRPGINTGPNLIYILENND